MTGFGRATYSNGDVYEGSFVKGKRQGEGKMTFSNGDTSKGTWQNGDLVSTPEDGVVQDN